ncbi:MAG TPA: transketolase [Patescibacteria group bacterium]|nr:transketolase [Patescibacteria group bacterium]
MRNKDLSTKKFAQEMRSLILDASFRTKVGHIGSCLSIVDILAVLYTQILSIKKLDDPNRDRFILSKGHAALALYSALYLKNILSQTEFDSFHTGLSRIAVHPEYGVPGVELATGSLGQGIGVAVGLALANSLRKSKSKVFALISDAELNEGSVWEAIMFCAHYKLPITVIIDCDGQQGFGYTKEVLSLEPLEEKWKTFGWSVTRVDGHNQKKLLEAIDKPKKYPYVIIADTILGKGVSFMERKVDWHYMPMTPDQYTQAKKELHA